MKKIAVSILIGLLVTTSVVGYSRDLSEALSGSIVRLHVIAESNSEKDQRVKLLVRDRILEKMKSLETKDEVAENLENIERAANEVLRAEGFEYTAKAEMGVFDFPTKYYDGFALPKGEYEAVRIVLGEGKGENWWCVLFPPLCMVDAATDEQEELLKETFGENYSVVADEGKVKFNIRFRLAEIF